MHPSQEYPFNQPQRPQTLAIGRTQVTTRPNLVSTPSTVTTMTLPSSLSGMVTQQQAFNTGPYQGGLQHTMFNQVGYNHLISFNFFLTNSQIHSHSTITSSNYRVRHCRTNRKRFTILYLRSKDLEFPSCYNHFSVMFSQF